MSGNMTPEEAHDEAMDAIDAEQWDKATAFAMTGLLGFAIGAAHGLERMGVYPLGR